jgi:hypothetical protein
MYFCFYAVVQDNQERIVMNRVPVASSTLASVGYCSDSRLLEAEFRSHALYRYFDVPAEIHRQLMAAQSKGAFFNAHVRNCFRYQEITPSSSIAATQRLKI